MPISPVLAIRAVDPNLRTVFKVKYVAEGVAYLDGGRSSGLTEGMKLEVKERTCPPSRERRAAPTDPRVVAELEVTAVAETSAVTDIHAAQASGQSRATWPISLPATLQALVQQRTLSATRKYPAVVTFTEGDPLDEEARAEVPRPPLPSVNRARGRIGFDYMGTMSHGTSRVTSSELGLVLRADITRIGGTYWNLSGYWRGRLTSARFHRPAHAAGPDQPHLSPELTYDNPNSALGGGVWPALSAVGAQPGYD